MPYIGKTPSIGNFVILDSITTSATDTFALTSGGDAYYPASANHCIVSLNGVIQAPISSFTISGSNIVFASALTASDSIDFITVLGDVLNVGTVSDGTITTAKLADSSVSLAKLTATGTKDATTFLRGDNTFQTIGANTPAFVLTNSGDQSISTGTWTQLTFDTTALDTDSAISSNTFTVPSGKGGTYTFFWGIHGIQGLDLGEFVQLGIYVNNVRSVFSDNRMTSHTTDVEFKFCANFQTVLSAGDTVKAYMYHNEGASQNATNASFSGYKLIE